MLARVGKRTVPKEDMGLELGKHQLALTSESVTLRDPRQYFCHLTSSVKYDGVWIPKGRDIGQRSWEESPIPCICLSMEE